MGNILAGIFFILHGLVHLIYFGHSMRYFEVKPGLTWPDGSWLFSGFAGDETTRLIAGIACIVSALGFVTGAVGLFSSQNWWEMVIIGSAIVSTALYVFCWDGNFSSLDGKGIFAILINVIIIVSITGFHFPKLK